MAQVDLLVALERAARSDAPNADAEFDAALDRLLAQAGADAAPEPGMGHRVQRRLQRSLAAGTVGAAAAGSRAGSASVALTGSGVHPIAPGVWARYGSKLIILAAGVAIGFVWGRAPSGQGGPAASSLTAGVPRVPASAPHGAERPRAPLGPTPEAEAPVAPAAAVTPLAPEAPLAPGAAASVGVEPAPRRPAPRAHAVPRARAHGAQDPQQHAESLRLVLEQLRKAQLFSRAGEHRRALGALDELDARVPLAVLQDEREVARTLALCDSGQEQAASELAVRIISRAPDSAYALSLRESCAGRAQLLEQMRDRTSNPVP